MPARGNLFAKLVNRVRTSELFSILFAIILFVVYMKREETRTVYLFKRFRSRIIRLLVRESLFKIFSSQIALFTNNLKLSSVEIEEHCLQVFRYCDIIEMLIELEVSSARTVAMSRISGGLINAVV